MKGGPLKPFKSVATTAAVKQPVAPHLSPKRVGSSGPHRSATNRTKRAIDILGAAVGLVLLAAVFVPIAIAIKLNSSGPIFFTQTRCGLRGRPFQLWKFRSMVVDADRLKHTVANQARGHMFKNDRDPRVTAVGRWLRCTSLDELPQFWNILRGDMSLVGTRPPTLDEVHQYKLHHFQRLNVKPGLTGEWQVRGRSKVDNFEEVVRLDLEYQQQWSNLRDLALILQTVRVVLRRDGAY
ncbi:sugar transferase [Synechococcus sp. PCC 7336]|uniref:sugar transferase n=1 Tax=Synechococcus sp. PCC 7336 TaxID=195250 RepID=UPI00034B4AAE|nr:sugar transferase [Synechococcus sp. PCC 7336]